ncbi:helix-turn-helix transcriptional regulator [Candidatus Poribacteria bacterium]|nr:helix-turn-helix transcriptional regulator [Candidatus Poribacteria bacterium]
MAIRVRTEEQRVADDKFLREFGGRLRRIREIRGIAQGEFSRMLGCSQTFMSLVESGKSQLSLCLFREACRILKIDANYLLGRKRMKK